MIYLLYISLGLNLLMGIRIWQFIKALHMSVSVLEEAERVMKIQHQAIVAASKIQKWQNPNGLVVVSKN